MSRALGLIGICKKANKLIQGFDVVVESAQNGEVSGIYLAKDISPKTQKEILFACADTNIPIVSLDITMDELGRVLGRRVGVIGITDSGLAKKLNSFGDSMK
ncbi:MAG: 50S ribosomal protein L7 [Clostridiales bacterium]|nr:50S ribosomal protein L7 [Clostridiales bacterium]